MGVEVLIPTLGDKFQDYREDIPGDSFNWGPVVQADKVRYFAFHHSVTVQTTKDNGDWKAECDVIANEHLAEGWGGVGYRFIICSDGTVAYVGDLSHGGSAVAGNNDIIFSACLVGDFTKELPTAAQIDSAHKLADWFLYNMPQYPLISTPDSIIGHKDAAELLHLVGATPTACPGPAWRDPNDSLRQRILDDNFEGYPYPRPEENQPAQTQEQSQSPAQPETPASPVEQPVSTETPIDNQPADPTQTQTTENSVPSIEAQTPANPDPVPSMPEVPTLPPDPTSPAPPAENSQQTQLAQNVGCNCIGCKTVLHILHSFFSAHTAEVQQDLRKVKEALGL